MYPLLPLAQRPDTSVAIEAALPEAAAVGRPLLWTLEVPASPNQCHQPGDALLGSRRPNAVAIARRECSGRPSARRPIDTGVIKITPPFYKQSLAMTWYKQNLGNDLV